MHYLYMYLPYITLHSACNTCLLGCIISMYPSSSCIPNNRTPGVLLDPPTHPPKLHKSCTNLQPTDPLYIAVCYLPAPKRKKKSNRSLRGSSTATSQQTRIPNIYNVECMDLECIKSTNRKEKTKRLQNAW